MKAFNERDLRAIKIGVAGLVLIGLYFLAGPWVSEWQMLRADLAAARQRLDRVAVDGEGSLPAEQLQLMSAVPKIEMPADEKTQGTKFRDTFTQQLQKAGIRARSLQYLAAKKLAGVGYRTLRLQSRGRCQQQQMLNLLGSLNENPYFVGVEELDLKPDARNRNELEFTITVSTFAK
ncbi:MAG: hypothetical protein GX455_03390 [Phycisphaerae bacterium]|nr:hypothetical protein [Phycisphaerae bacterium]